MDLGLGKRGLDFALRNKKWILLAACGYFRVYQSPTIARKRKRISKVLGALFNLLKAASDSAEVISVISRDLTEFLRSDSDQIPNSLKQISKLASSDEVHLSLIRFTQAISVGLLRGYRLDSRNGDSGDGGSGFTDRVMDKLFTKAGSGFASAVIGSFARNLVMAFWSDELSGEQFISKSKWVDAICSKDCGKLIGDCVQLFVSTAVAVYLDKTVHVNAFDELFAGLTNPKNEQKVKETLVSICNGAVETFIKTSRRVPKESGSARGFAFHRDKNEPEFDLSPAVGLRSLRRGGNTWLSRACSTLSVPSNGRFVVDLSGRVTFETVKSLLELLSEKLNDRMRNCIELVIETGNDATRRVKARSSVVYSLCLFVPADRRSSLASRSKTLRKEFF